MMFCMAGLHGKFCVLLNDRKFFVEAGKVFSWNSLLTFHWHFRCSYIVVKHIVNLGVNIFANRQLLQDTQFMFIIYYYSS